MSGFVKIALDDYYSDSNWTTIITKYWLLAERVSDPRVEGWLMFDSPVPTFALVLVYLSFVVLAGPMWMSSRKPFRLQSVLVTYNALQVLLSSYMFYEHLMSGWWGDYSLSCQPVDYSDNENARRMLHLCWVYYFSKLSEFADTVFFVLRKKKSQITWLHLYHHSLTPFEAWLLVKFVAGGHGTFSNIINNFVHVVMYGYYMVAAMGPQYHKYLWWKKHLTTVQLIQFFMVLFHSMSALFYDCGYPKLIAFGLVLHSMVFIVLFMNFYMHAYKKKDKPKRQVEASNNNNNETPVHEHVKNNDYLQAKEEATELVMNGHFKAGDKSEGYLIDRESNSCVKNGYLKSSEEANGHIKTNGHLKNGDINGFHTNLKVNREANGLVKNGYIQSTEKENHDQNGYTNGHIPKSITDKKVQ